MNFSDFHYRHFFRACFPALSAVLAVVLPLRGNLPLRIETLTGAPTRVVWAQEYPDSVYSLACFFTGDSRGAHPLFPAPVPSNYPLITSDGSRIVFSTEDPPSCYIVNWDGSGMRSLGPGIGMDCWTDPHSKVEWVYLVPHFGESAGPVLRRRLDDPSVQDTVWKTPFTSFVFFVLSPDGRKAAGSFPWPRWGVADLEKSTWREMGTGCFPSIAPDNSFRTWIFDGYHRNLTIFDSSGTRHAIVDIHTAPGIRGWEVYHPRWSNHSRILAMTGPYSAGRSDSCVSNNCGFQIGKGGKNVEVYLGRFNAEFTAVEQWVQLTDNARWDLSPDVWVQPPTRVSRPQSAPPSYITPRFQRGFTIGGSRRVRLPAAEKAIAVYDIRGRRILDIPAGKGVPVSLRGGPVFIAVSDRSRLRSCVVP